MANETDPIWGLPPLPAYTLTPRPRLVPWVSDAVLQMIAPVIAYWVISLMYHALDTYDLCAQYRLHTPAELLKRNRVTRYEVVRDVVIQQAIQAATGLSIAYFDPVETVGKEAYDIAVWARRLRLAQRHIPTVLAALGVDATGLAAKCRPTAPQLAAVVAGGQYSALVFAPWEHATAAAIYWVGVPLVQFAVAFCFVDTWQYFLHRAMHVNKFLYTAIHSRHHRLYVPYAFGSLYNHPVEGFLLDTLGTGLAYMLTGMTVRQGLCFFTGCTIKTVDDHCGYAFPWDPLQHVTSNNAAYHDVHHQSWGIKTNYSQPFFTFWDRVLGTAWTGGDISARYQRDRIAAQKRVDADADAAADVDGAPPPPPSVVNSPHVDLDRAQAQARSGRRQVLNDDANGGVSVIEDEIKEEQDAKRSTRRSTRRKSGFDTKSITDRVSGSLHGRSSAILHADGVH